MESNELIAYAMDFSAYLVLKIKNIDRIIVHGSAARGDFDKESDIDLFVDTRKKVENEIEKAKENWKGTSKFREWKLKGVERDF